MDRPGSALGVDGRPDGSGLLGTLAARHLLELVSPIILPSPAETIEDLLVVGRNLLTGDYMLPALWVTTQEVFSASSLAVAIGFALGVLVGETSFGERAVMPYLVAIDTMPKVAFAPLFVSWLGFGIASKVALAAFIADLPGRRRNRGRLHAADQNARMLFKTMGASRWQTLVKLKLPTGLPHFFTGLKIGAVGVVAGAITGEFLGGGKGFGELIRVAASQLDTPRVFSLIIYLSLLGLDDLRHRRLDPAPFRILASGQQHPGRPEVMPPISFREHRV